MRLAGAAAGGLRRLARAGAPCGAARKPPDVTIESADEGRRGEGQRRPLAICRADQAVKLSQGRPLDEARLFELSENHEDFRAAGAAEPPRHLVGRRAAVAHPPDLGGAPVEPV